MPDTVIIGAGIIGCATAYYLSESQRTSPQSIHLVEASPELFKCASGLAAGFLAADWFAPPVAALGALSFRLHKSLAEQHNGREQWGYSRSTGTSLSQSRTSGSGNRYDWLRTGSSRAEAAAFHEFREGEGAAWLTKKKGDRLEVISEDDTVAQVDPLKLSQFLLEESLKRGVKLHHPVRAVTIAKDAEGNISSVKIRSEKDGTETDIPCSRLAITSGAWSPAVFSTLFPKSNTRIPVTSLAGHSLVLRSPRWSKEHEDKGCHAVFSTETDGFSPEIFSRIGGEIYIAGLNDADLQLPKTGADAKIDPDSIQRLKVVARNMLGLPEGEQDDLEVLREGLCFRPVTRMGTPIISRIADSKLGDGLKTKGDGNGGVFLAAGHGPWGIALSVGTGKALSELIEGTETSADIRSLKL
ncbi:FAD dependent oxidoreductase [Rhizodiscina lignyota]|uniref:FAD dependent oxidoreductase n=1 Tax=Rhizodiscina lignyota TaxID=1504668 RepID=A0A9P4IFH8_9PEZI|nr:FAD dependent oxidoreductase [Rhizodiscina lignyota]